MDAAALPLAKVLEGGTWAAGRAIAFSRAAPTARHRSKSSVTARCFDCYLAPHPRAGENRVMQGVTVVDHPLVQHKLTLMRDKNRSTKSFRELVNEIGMLLCYEVTRDLPLTDVEIETPLAKMMSQRIAGKKLVFAPILRAGPHLRRRHARSGAGGARRPYRALSRSADASRRSNITSRRRPISTTGWSSSSSRSWRPATPRSPRSNASRNAAPSRSASFA